MKKNALCVFLVLLLIFVVIPKAQSQDSVHVDLNKAIEIALSETPTMRIADRNVHNGIRRSK